MSVSKVLERWPFKASEDLSKKQFFFVQLSSTSTISLATTGQAAVFILEETPKENEYGTCVLVGVGKVKAKAEIKAGELVQVAQAGGGEAEKATAVSGQYVVGVALTTAKAGGYVTVLVHGGSGAFIK